MGNDEVDKGASSPLREKKTPSVVFALFIYEFLLLGG